MPLLNLDKKSLSARTILYAVDLLLNENTTTEQRDATKESLKTVFQNIMPFLRGDANEEQFLNAAEQIGKIYTNVASSVSSAFVDELSAHSGLEKSDAFLHAVPAICGAMRKSLAENENPELLERLTDATTAVCGNAPIRELKRQLLFISEFLGVFPPEFIGDDKCAELVKALSEKYNFEYSILEETVYGIFHKIRLSKLREHADNHPKSKISEHINCEYASLDDDAFVDNPFYAKKRERAIFVKGLQKYTLETLVLTKKFLESHGLRFYLTEGTLLGAIRHNGFIPWDDDVDIAMPREDYDRLVELANEGKIPPELNFDSLENNPKHWVLGAKMQLTRKTPYIQHKVTKLSKCNGPYVDIFPIDYWNRPAGLKFSIANICVKASRRLLFMKTGYSIATKKKPLRILGRLILPFLRNTWIEKFAIRNMKKFYNGNRKYSVNLCSYYPYYKEVFPTGFFGEPKYVSFEGEQMPVPCEYDCMLKLVYGKNYDTIPPVRVTNMRKHAFELNEEI